jgi:hypothetical protein
MAIRSVWRVFGRLSEPGRRSLQGERALLTREPFDVRMRKPLSELPDALYPLGFQTLASTVTL